MQNCSKLFLSKSSNPKMSRTPMDKHWEDRENRCYWWELPWEHLFGLRALHLAEHSAVADALEPATPEQGTPCFNFALGSVNCILSCPIPWAGRNCTGCSHLGSQYHRPSTCVALTEQPPPVQPGRADEEGVWHSPRQTLPCLSY